ncbi:kinase-like domain-containing protein [Scheffersomyces amazonensis]|uniref:kinase-like domain-containing protein n=1 Tax=Scheffersomyces amazonensis TaxID=1078765 RepID=UPI00315C6E7C
MSINYKRYVNRRQIFRGHISDVYIAEDVETQLDVCLKVVDLDLVVKPHNVRYELSMLQKLHNRAKEESINHDIICQLLGSYEIGDDLTIVMPKYAYTLESLLMGAVRQYVRVKTKFNWSGISNGGSNSATSTQRFNVIEPDHSRELIINLLKGVAFIHKHEIIHRDLKPANIFFKTDDIRYPIIGDFGISYDNNNANQVRDEPTDEKYFDVSTGIYKAPELCLGINNYEYEIDIWAVGIIFTVIYSPHFKSILESKDINKDESEELAMSDLYLLTQIFKTFGTPLIEDKTNKYQELVWEELDNDEKYHFKQFNFRFNERKSIKDILPRCEDAQITDIFNRMMYYDRTKRLQAQEAVDLFHN